MIKAYSPDSSPEELEVLSEMVKSTAEFLNDNPKAKAFMEDPATAQLSQEEFVTRLLEIAQEYDSLAFGSINPT
ncbi:MAG: hypothetical protein P8104_07185 [Gammaproteobacteria bacterium]